MYVYICIWAPRDNCTVKSGNKPHKNVPVELNTELRLLLHVLGVKMWQWNITGDPIRCNHAWSLQIINSCYKWIFLQEYTVCCSWFLDDNQTTVLRAYHPLRTVATVKLDFDWPSELWKTLPNVTFRRARTTHVSTMGSSRFIRHY